MNSTHSQVSNPKALREITFFFKHELRVNTSQSDLSFRAIEKNLLSLFSSAFGVRMKGVQLTAPREALCDILSCRFGSPQHAIVRDPFH